MEVKYVKVFVDNLDALESLSDAQRGKLFTAILRYGRDREEPQLKGAARVLFPMFRAQIDREIVGMEETARIRSKVGQIGGRNSQKIQAEAKSSKQKQNKQNQANRSKTSKMKQMQAKQA